MAAIAWLKQLALPEIDRLEMNHLLVTMEQVQQRLKELEKVIAERSGVSKAVACRPIRSWPLGRRSGCFAAVALSSAQVDCIVAEADVFGKMQEIEKEA